MTSRTHKSGGNVCAMLAGIALASTASAHVQLNSPNGGETLVVGETVTIEWEVTIEHDTESWHLFYSTEGEDGPWIDIAMDLPVGDPSGGALHEFTWNVPDDASSNVFVRVVQNNAEGQMDWDDVSDDSITIEGGGCVGDIDNDGAVDIGDLLMVLGAWGACGSCEADLNGDLVVDIADLLLTLGAWGAC